MGRVEPSFVAAIAATIKLRNLQAMLQSEIQMLERDVTILLLQLLQYQKVVQVIIK